MKTTQFDKVRKKAGTFSERLAGKITKAMESRRKFSDNLPYLAYDPDTNLYHNKDGTIGFAIECTAAGGRAGKVANRLLYRLAGLMPQESILTISEILRDGQETLLITLKISEKKEEKFQIESVRNAFHMFLADQGLHPAEAGPLRLIEVLNRIFDPYGTEPPVWIEHLSLSESVRIDRGDVHVEPDRLESRGAALTAVTPKSLGFDLDLRQTPIMYSALLGNQAPPAGTILSTMLLIKDPSLQKKLRWPEDTNRKGFVGAHFVPRGLGDYRGDIKVAEFFYLTVIHWFISPDGEESETLDRFVAQAKGLMDAAGQIGQQERKNLLPALLLGALPFGYLFTEQIHYQLDRYFIAKQLSDMQELGTAEQPKPGA